MRGLRRFGRRDFWIFGLRVWVRNFGVSCDFGRLEVGLRIWIEFGKEVFRGLC